MNYNGFGAWCAAYAFLNTTQRNVATPEEYELLSGTPFGIKHRPNDLHRTLTPYVEPCMRVVETAQLLGFSAAKAEFAKTDDVIDYLAAMIGERVMAGPIDMGFLFHLPQNLYYSGQSHYVSINTRSSGCFLLTDSEGVLCYKYNRTALKQILNTDKIPESNGCINVWYFNKIEEYGLSPENFRYRVLNQAAINMKNAEYFGQGGEAFIKCGEALVNAAPKEWPLKLFYELNYIIQRKHLFLKWSKLWNISSITELLSKQIELLCLMRSQASNKNPIDMGLISQIARHEHCIACTLSDLMEEEVEKQHGFNNGIPL